ncbi:MAG TPA: hypothetical protein VGF97_03960 [Rhizomicrobium sp.]|jgi:hypothetical protein
MNGAFDRTARIARETGPGFVGSVLLHVLAAVFVLFLMWKSATPPPDSLARFVPIEIVHPAEKTTSAEHEKAIVPRPLTRRASREIPTSPRRPVALAPTATRAPPDDLDIRLKALARLRQPQTRLPLPDNGASDATDTGEGAAVGRESAYSLRDFIRAQVERRWSLDLTKAGVRNFTVPIHVIVSASGEVKSAEIVDRGRSASDPVYRDVALSARNAVLLSSPIALPAGHRGKAIDVILVMRSRDALQ